MEELQSIISFTETYNPVNYITYSIITLNDNRISDEFSQILDIILYKPKIFGISIEEREKKIVPGFVNIIFLILNFKNLYNFFENHVYYHNRRDKCIFIGYEKTMVKHLFDEKWFQKIGFKIALSLDTSFIWIQSQTWNGGKMNKIKNKSAVKSRSNPRIGGILYGRHLKTVNYAAPPYFFKTEDFSGVPVIDGSLFRLMKIYAVKFNFTFEAEYTGTTYSKKHTNGTVDGYAVYMAQPKFGYDLGYIWGFVRFHYGVAESPSYGHSIFTNRLLFAVQHGKIEIQWYAFLQPFEVPVWILTILIFFCISVTQSICMYTFETGRKFTYIVWDSATFLPLGLLLEQGLQNIPKGIKIFSMLTLLTTTLLGTGYRSTLRTNLSFPRKERVPQTHEALYEQSADYDISFLILGREQTHAQINKYFRKMEPQIKMIKSPNVEEVAKNALLSDKKSAIMYWYIYFKASVARGLMLNENISPFLYSTDQMISVHTAMILTKFSPLADSFILPIYASIECGLNTHLEKNIFYNFIQDGRRKLLLNSANETKEIVKKLEDLQYINEFERSPLSLENVRIILLITPLGVVLGAFLICFEFYFYYFHKG